MDVASFVFGALPIALKALENYEHCLKPAKNYWKYENTLKQIQMHVFVQQEQLKATMVGLDVDLDSLTTDKLRHQLRLAYTKNKCEHFIGILERMKKLLEEMLDKLDVDVAGKVCDDHHKGIALARH